MRLAKEGRVVRQVGRVPVRELWERSMSSRDNDEEEEEEDDVHELKGTIFVKRL
jgi:hypothetical protein